MRDLCIKCEVSHQHENLHIITNILIYYIVRKGRGTTANEQENEKAV